VGKTLASSIKILKKYYVLYIALIICFFCSIILIKYLIDPLIPIKVFVVLVFILWVYFIIRYCVKSLDIVDYYNKFIKKKNNNIKISYVSLVFMNDYNDEKLKSLLIEYRSILKFMLFIFVSIPLVVIIYGMVLKLFQK